MTKQELKECYPGDYVNVSILDREYECQIIRFEDYDFDGFPDKAMVAGKIMTIAKPGQLTFLRHEPRIEKLLNQTMDEKQLNGYEDLKAELDKALSDIKAYRYELEVQKNFINQKDEYIKEIQKNYAIYEEIVKKLRDIMKYAESNRVFVKRGGIDGT